ncbi:hypothetical protein [Tenacibaculum salmonis]|uniref:hypothetical protein n=1 Tax=Tenacibaculum sp. P3-BQ1 TaxID=3232310 RepID=UPI0034DE8896
MTKASPILLALSLFFAACSSNETEVTNAPQQKLLESYTVKRDVNGAYSIDLNTTTNTVVNTVKNTDNSNEIILSEVNRKTANKYTNDFTTENNQLIIGFLDTNKGERKKISIEDDNITFAKGGVTEFLNSYSVTENSNGTYLLNFKVNKNIATEFSYNEAIETYEVHLSKGRAKQLDFSETITLSEDNSLRIDFVNHTHAGRGEEGDPPPHRRKPRLIIENGEE